MTASAPAPVASTTVADNSAFGGPNAAQAAAANAQLASQSAPLLVTSGASRATTANNVATLNNAVNNAAVSNATPVKTTTPATSTTTPNQTAQPAAASTAAPATNAAPVTTASPATPYTPPAGSTQTSLPGGGTGYYNQSTDTMTDANGKPLTFSQQTGSWIDPTTGMPPAATSSVSSTGQTGATAPGGSSDAAIDSAVSALPPSMQGLYQSTLTQQQSQQNYAYQTLQAAQATLANDPAATQAINAIYAKYQTLIDQMNQKNKQVLGSASSSVGAFGGLGVMSQGFLSDEADQASSRISALVSEQNAAVLQAQAAYGKEDLDAFNAAMDNYNKTIAGMNTALSNLSSAVDKQITEQQASQRLALDTQTAQVTNDGKVATANAAQIASQLKASGVDLGSYDYTALAKQLGITDPTTLGSAVMAASQTSDKNDLDTANVKDEISNRDTQTSLDIAKTNKELSAPSGTAADRLQSSISAGQSNFVSGAKLPDGTPIIDSSGYATPLAWKQLIAQAPANGLTRQQFIDNYSQYIYTKKGEVSAAYGLTPAEVKKITTTAPDTSSAYSFN